MISSVTSQFSLELNDIRDQVNSVRSASKNNETGVEDIINKNEQTNSTVEILTEIVQANQDNTIKLQKLVQEFKLS